MWPSGYSISEPTLFWTQTFRLVFNWWIFAQINWYCHLFRRKIKIKIAESYTAKKIVGSGVLCPFHVPPSTMQWTDTSNSTEFSSTTIIDKLISRTSGCCSRLYHVFVLILECCQTMTFRMTVTLWHSQHRLLFFWFFTNLMIFISWDDEMLVQFDFRNWYRNSPVPSCTKIYPQI